MHLEKKKKKEKKIINVKLAFPLMNLIVQYTKSTANQLIQSQYIKGRIPDYGG